MNVLNCSINVFFVMRGTSPMLCANSSRRSAPKNHCGFSKPGKCVEYTGKPNACSKIDRENVKNHKRKDIGR